MPVAVRRFYRVLSTVRSPIFLVFALFLFSLFAVFPAHTQYVSDGLIAVEQTGNGAVVRAPVVFSGWVLDRNAPAGNRPGISQVDIYEGPSCSGRLLASQPGPFAPRPDVPAVYGLPADFTNSGFQLSAIPSARGWVTFAICGRSRVNGQIAVYDTRTVYLPDVRLAVDQPGSSATVFQQFRINGWSLDPVRGQNQGTGVNLITIYEGTQCAGNLLTQTGGFTARDDLRVIYGLDATYRNSGFSIPIVPVSTGNLTFTVCARSEISGQFWSSVTRTVLVQNIPPDMAVDQPLPNSTVRRNVAVSGWAIDRNALYAQPLFGPGIDRVRVFARAPGAAFVGCSAPSFAAEIGMSLDRVDVRAAFSLPASFLRSGFEGLVPLSGAGIYLLDFCGRSTVTGNYDVVRSVRVEVPPPRFYVDFPTANATVPTTFQISGWAFDPAADSGPGNVPLRLAFSNDCDGGYFFDVIYGGYRPDVQAVFNLDSSFANTGWSRVVSLPPGIYTATVCLLEGNTWQPRQVISPVYVVGAALLPTQTTTVIPADISTDTPEPTHTVTPVSSETPTNPPEPTHTLTLTPSETLTETPISTPELTPIPTDLPMNTAIAMSTETLITMPEPTLAFTQTPSGEATPGI